MVIWPAGDTPALQTGPRSHWPFATSGASMDVLGDAKAWGFGHDVRKPRLQFGMSGPAHAR